MKEVIVIPRDKLETYVESFLRLCALDFGGVDSWSWYGVSITDYLERRNAEDFDELVEKEIGKYEVMV